MNKSIRIMKVCVAQLSELHLKLYESSFVDMGFYEKGKKFYYDINNIYGQATYQIYDIETNGCLFQIGEKKFHKYFVDLENFRQKQLEEILK